MGLGSKKRRRDAEEPPKVLLDTSKPTARFKPIGGRNYTLSIALPGSIIHNAQSQELKTALAGQIARALAVFCVDEVVIFNDREASLEQDHPGIVLGHVSDTKYTGQTDPEHFLMHLLSYLETPPYLRKFLFPIHPNLRMAGTLPSLDMPHHLRTHEWCEYREGVTISTATTSDPALTSRAYSNLTSSRAKSKTETRQAEESGSYVEAGLQDSVFIPTVLPPYTRVTLQFPPSISAKQQVGSAVAVDPSIPRSTAGYYWGYTIRGASSLSTVFTECTFPAGYDLAIGTSERGKTLPLNDRNDQAALASYSHLLVVFGGLAGLEAAVQADPELAGKADGAEALFDYWLNLCPGQGSRTIRTEEALWIGMTALWPLIQKRGSIDMCKLVHQYAK